MFVNLVNDSIWWFSNLRYEWMVGLQALNFYCPKKFGFQFMKSKLNLKFQI